MHGNLKSRVFLHQDNALAHKSAAAMAAMAAMAINNQCWNGRIVPYLHDLTPFDNYLVPKMKKNSGPPFLRVFAFLKG